MIKQLRQFGANLLLLALVVLASPALSHAQTIEYYHLDALGSVRAVSNQAGAVVEQHDYLPFGEEDLSSGGSQSLRFTSKERDRESGFDYFGARYYATRTARFTTVDPAMEVERNVADPQNWNRYAYAGNNPLKNVDPDGQSWWTKTAKVVINGGNMASTFADVGENLTVFGSPDPQVGALPRIGAWLGIVSEALPVSVGDARGAYRAVSQSVSMWGKQHGGDAHWGRITQIADAMKRQGWDNILVNRRQRDAVGNVVGTNRPDVAGTHPVTLQRHNIEVDNKAKASQRHGVVNQRNDPNAKNTLVLLPK